MDGLSWSRLEVEGSSMSLVHEARNDFAYWLQLRTGMAGLLGNWLYSFTSFSFGEACML
jgi:hypothetical protein